MLCELASGLVARGHDVRFLTFDGEGRAAFPTNAGVEDIGPSPGGRWLMRDRARQAALLRAIERQADADVVLANHHLTAKPTADANLRARKFYYIQAYEPDFFPNQWWRQPQIAQARDSYALPLGQIANCAMVARQALGAGWEQVPLVRPGIDPALFHESGRSPAGRPLVVGTIGRHEHWKGSADCFEAVRRVREQGVALDFRVAFGNIPKGHETIERRDEAPRDDRELAQWYRSLDVLLAAVHGGGAPYPPIEALACGAAVVTTPNDHVVNERNALTAPQQVPAALAAALARMLTDAPLRERLVAQGMQDVRAHHWPQVVATLERVLAGETPAPAGSRS